jgi:hypothetical protein
VAWQDTVDAVAAGITAGGIIVGGWWAYKRFGIEAPHWTRADAQVSAVLLPTADEHDVLQVDVSISAIGSARLAVVRDERRGPEIAVYRFTNEMRKTSQPDEWTNRVAAQRVLPRGQDIIEAGETIVASHLVPLGPRASETFAYRIEFTFWARDDNFERDFAWVASDYVLLDTSGKANQG